MINLAGNYCFLLPCYNHPQVVKTVSKLQQYNIPFLIVDDGSDALTKEVLAQLQKDNALVTVITRTLNGGKGAAIKTGILKARDDAFTHAFQIDADGQHDIDAVSEFLKQSDSDPQYMVCGYPVFDVSVPSSRQHARKFTNMWVSVETLSFKIKDAMCGFRIYPVNKTADVIESAVLGNYMDFDIEVLVRYFWRDERMMFLPVNVIYPEDGASHFRMLKDNVLISKLHTKLVILMLIRLPKLLLNRLLR